MLIKRGAIHHYVVQVHDHKTIEEWLEHLVHECAKCGGCISKAKRQHKEFKRLVLLECNLCTSFALFTSLNINVLHLIIVIYLCFTFVGAILLIDDKIEL